MNLEFHFGNDETHECFVWLSENEAVWVANKLKAAFELAANDDSSLAISTSHLVCEHLATLLEDGLEEVDQGFCEIDCEVGTERLSKNLLKLAYGQIRFEVVAEAIMRSHQKWFPDIERPEFK